MSQTDGDTGSDFAEVKRNKSKIQVESESAVHQPTGPPGPDLTALTQDMFEKTATFLQGEFEGTAEEYALLEKMNKATAQRYADMQQVTINIAKSLHELNDSYTNLRPYLEQVVEIDRSSQRLEEAAYALDAYVKTLEARFKTLEKRS